MKKWILRTNTGYGDSYEIVELEDAEDPLEVAYEMWKEEVESYADYEALKYTKEIALELDLEDEEEG